MAFNFQLANSISPTGLVVGLLAKLAVHRIRPLHNMDFRCVKNAIRQSSKKGREIISRIYFE
ncbi:MAG: hypothetical protein LBQ66_04375 [Planctomycetaceae bacterium]|jgi:hypothetical protein|nr:hypothetical protein [Planctomycetaceae bacterium]